MNAQRWVWTAVWVGGLCLGTLGTHAQDQAKVTMKIQAVVPEAPAEAPAMEDVPYLGLAVTPTNPEAQAQLKLGEGVGLTVMDVAADSPAAKAGLRRLDVLHKLDDQLIINQEQLGTLVRLHGADREVTLTLYRDGEAQQIKLTIGTTQRRVLPRPIGQVRLAPGAAQVRPAGPRIVEEGGWVGDDPAGDAAWDRMDQQMDRIRRELNDNEALRDAQRQQIEAMLQQMRDRRAQAGGGAGPGNVSHAMRINDGEHTIDLRTTNGDKQLKVTDAQGNLIFEGPINTDAQRAAVPADVMAKVERFEKRAKVEIRLDRLDLKVAPPQPEQPPAPAEPEPHTLN